MRSRSFRQRIPGVTQGISRQAPTIRFPHQVSDARNASFSLMEGASKRAGTVHEANAGTADGDESYRLHRLERDDLEEYVVVYGRVSDNTVIRVLDSNNPRNRRQWVELFGATGGTFTLSFAGEETTDLDFDATAEEVKAALEILASIGEDNVAVELSGSKYEITLSDQLASHALIVADAGDLTGTTPTIEVYGTLAKLTIDGPAQTYLDVNNPAADDLRLCNLVDSTFIVNTLVKAKTADGSNNSLDATTFPVEMKRTALSPPTFTITVPTWDSGPPAGTPAPNTAPRVFWGTGKQIRDAVFHRSRLWFAVDEAAVSSQGGDLYNFFPESATLVTATDPIEYPLGSDQVTIIDYLVPFRKSLLILTKAGRQFELDAQEILTPETASITASTAYNTQPVRPAAIGTFLYMAGANPQRSQIYEYLYDDLQLSNRAFEVSKHVLDLIPPALRTLVSSNNHETLVCVPTSEVPDLNAEISSSKLGGGLWSNPVTWLGRTVPQEENDVSIEVGDTVTFDEYPDVSRLFVYRQFVQGQQKLQSAWTVFEFDVDVIQDAVIIDDVLWILRRDDAQGTEESPASALMLESLELGDNPAPPTGFPLSVHVDHQIRSGAGVYADGVTTWTLPHNDPHINVAVLSQDFDEDAGTAVDVVTQGDQATAVGDFSGQRVILGREITFEIELSQSFPRNPDGNPILEGYHDLHKVIVDHQRAGEYQLRTRTKNRTDRVTVHEPDELLESFGEFEVNVAGNTEDLVISIESTDHRPLTISGVEYHGLHTPTSP